MVYDVINCVVFVILAQLFFSAFIERKEQSAIFSTIVSLFWMAVIFSEYSLLKSVLVARLIGLVLIDLVFMMLLYKRKSLIKCISVSILYSVLVLSSEMFVFAIHKYLDPNLRIETMLDSDFVLYMGFLCRLLESIIIFWLRIAFRRVRNADIQSKLWIIYTIFPIYSMSLIIAIAYVFDGPISPSQHKLFAFIASSLLLINLFIYWFVRQESQRTIEKQKNELEIEHARGIMQLYEQITKEREIVRKREHEYKNTITALRGLSEQKEYGKIDEILARQNEDLINYVNVFNTGNLLVNAILNTKYAEAVEKGILFRFEFNDLSELKIDDRDCIVILSNILNNAIEASEKCPKEGRYIFVKAVIEEGQFIFACRNSFIDDKDPEMKSKKKDVVSHGYGMKNIKEAVARNDGEIVFDKTDNEFVSVAILKKK